MKRMKSWLATAVLMVIVALQAGCSGTKVYPVRGKVTFEGKPLVGGGSIAFVPLGSGPGRAAGGVIAEDGTYRLTTERDGDGSMTGEFRVVITQQTEKEPVPSVDGQPPTKGSSLPQADRIPAAFSDHLNSPTRAKVEAKGMNEIDINLKWSDVPAPTRPAGAMGPRLAPSRPVGRG